MQGVGTAFITPTAIFNYIQIDQFGPVASYALSETEEIRSTVSVDMIRP